MLLHEILLVTKSHFGSITTFCCFTRYFLGSKSHFGSIINFFFKILFFVARSRFVRLHSVFYSILRLFPLCNFIHQQQNLCLYTKFIALSNSYSPGQFNRDMNTHYFVLVYNIYKTLYSISYSCCHLSMLCLLKLL